MRRFSLLVLALVAVAGCRGGVSEEPPVLPPPKWLDHYLLPVTNMSYQPKFISQGQNDFYPDGMDNRLPPENTIARGSLKADSAFYRGVDAEGKPVTEYPVELTRELLERGRERYDIYCSMCHDKTGRGQGIVPKSGWVAPPSFYDERILALGPGDLFGIITNGVRTMPSYAKQIPEADRWAIVAYVQALQTGNTASIENVPADQRNNLR